MIGGPGRPTDGPPGPLDRSAMWGCWDAERFRGPQLSSAWTTYRRGRLPPIESTVSCVAVTPGVVLPPGTYFAMFAAQAGDVGRLLGGASVPFEYQAGSIWMGYLNAIVGNSSASPGMFVAVRIPGRILPPSVPGPRDPVGRPRARPASPEIGRPLRIGRSAVVGGWDSHRATGGPRPSYGRMALYGPSWPVKTRHAHPVACNKP
jgi:hypothetical protein